MEWYERRRAAQLREFDAANPRMAAWLREIDALYLFGTFGFEAVMRPDGTVLVAVDEHWGEPGAPEPPWRPATESERTISIVAARERWPEVAQLLPPRPAAARDCPTCQGHGALPIGATSVLCSDCGALGWVIDAAT